MKKRLLAMIMAFVMAMSLLPMSALATQGDDQEEENKTVSVTIYTKEDGKPASENEILTTRNDDPDHVQLSGIPHDLVSERVYSVEAGALYELDRVDDDDDDDDQSDTSLDENHWRVDNDDEDDDEDADGIRRLVAFPAGTDRETVLTALKLNYSNPSIEIEDGGDNFSNLFDDNGLKNDTVFYQETEEYNKTGKENKVEWEYLTKQDDPYDWLDASTEHGLFGDVMIDGNQIKNPVLSVSAAKTIISVKRGSEDMVSNGEVPTVVRVGDVVTWEIEITKTPANGVLTDSISVSDMLTHTDEDNTTTLTLHKTNTNGNLSGEVTSVSDSDFTNGTLSLYAQYIVQPGDTKLINAVKVGNNPPVESNDKPDVGYTVTYKVGENVLNDGIYAPVTKCKGETVTVEATYSDTSDTVYTGWEDGAPDSKVDITDNTFTMPARDVTLVCQAFDVPAPGPEVPDPDPETKVPVYVYAKVVKDIVEQESGPDIITELSDDELNELKALVGDQLVWSSKNGKWMTLGMISEVPGLSTPDSVKNASDNDWTAVKEKLGSIDRESNENAKENQEINLKKVTWTELKVTSNGATDYVKSGNTWHLDGVIKLSDLVNLTVEKELTAVNGDAVPEDFTEAKLDDTLTWTITVSNSGAMNAYIDLPTDVLSWGEGESDWRSLELDPGENVKQDNNKYIVPAATVDEDVMTPGSITFTATYEITEDDLGKTLLNTASIGENGPSGESEVPVEAENPALSVTKSVDKVEAKIGDTLTYTIVVKNTGNVTLKDILVTDTLSNAYGTVTITESETDSYTVNDDGTVTIASLAPAADVTITATYKVRSKDAGKTLTNTAVAKSGDTEGTGSSEGTKVVKPSKPSKPSKPPVLNTEDHYAYVVGYPDGTVQPQGNITRAEVATIFFRMLTDDSRNEFWSQTNSYSDVSEGQWFNNAISTLANAGILSGYPDGTFRPNAPITRAEFTKIAASFFEQVEYTIDNPFSDVDDDDWFYKFVMAAYEDGLITGYPEGDFRPNANINRAEAMTIVNRTLGRAPDADYFLKDMIVWPDNPKSAWYYEAVQEATNSHEYVMKGTGTNQYEEWTKILEVRDWPALEKEWSDANSSTGGEVVK